MRYCKRYKTILPKLFAEVKTFSASPARKMSAGQITVFYSAVPLLACCSSSPAKLVRNSRMLCPIPLPSAGSLLAPKITRTIAKMTNSSVVPRLPISHSYKESQSNMRTLLDVNSDMRQLRPPDKGCGTFSLNRSVQEKRLFHKCIVSLVETINKTQVGGSPILQKGAMLASSLSRTHRLRLFAKKREPG
jgi:hypothetical protein